MIRHRRDDIYTSCALGGKKNESECYQKTIKKIQNVKSQELKNTIIKIKNSVDLWNNKLDTDGEKIKELEDQQGGKKSRCSIEKAMKNADGNEDSQAISEQFYTLLIKSGKSEGERRRAIFICI